MTEKKTGKTPEYTKRAVKRYQDSKDRIYLLLDSGTKERIKQKYGNGVSLNGYIKGLIEKDLTATGGQSLPWD